MSVINKLYLGFSRKLIKEIEKSRSEKNTVSSAKAVLFNNTNINKIKKITVFFMKNIP